MNDEFRAGWTSRAENLDEGTKKVLETLKGFRACLPDLRRWSCEDPPFVPFPMSFKFISDLLIESHKRLKLPNLGFGLYAWTGTKERAFGLSLSFGNTGQLAANRVSLHFPPEVGTSGKMARCFLAVLVRVWTPEYATLNPVTHSEEGRFELGPLCYLSPKTVAFLGDISRRRIRREPFEGGFLYTLSPSQIRVLYGQSLKLQRGRRK